MSEKTIPLIVTPDVARKQFISTFRYTARHLGRWMVFSDFITLAASELDMARIRTPENIENSRRICDRYNAADLENLKKLFSLMVVALNGQFHDFLGAIFMELELGSSDMGQFFTPYHLQSLIARMLSGDIDDIIKKQGWLELSEPTCSAAGMVIAFAECMLEAGYNPSQQLYVNCIDIDPVAANMAFIQLSLLGIPAEIVTGNALTMQFNQVRYTPAFYINGWRERLAFRRRIERMRKFLQSKAA
ncbi:N-6 DNA methylase [Photorhabdus khanii]|uniref:N-6 DNA methylase n=1 Tax=Photorhabdus khanii TaxID=1004150 RepID=A0A7C9GLE0_9GAMM|nr:N-6 DNA methylase [Photorhabdus khanii]MQL50078.1 N-6 DNA methylase [Photorhabdus khanii]